ncbi:MAG: hypothetical protein EXR29_06250 [Betaproteobacteria bacterium]|nr:hypothetical protein [Betaproteobacteria bacterium]
MSDIERIEANLPIGMKLVLSQLQRDSLVARAKRERGECIAASFKALYAGLVNFAAQVRVVAARCTAARLRHQG